MAVKRMIDIRLAEISDVFELLRLASLYTDGNCNTIDGIEASLKSNTQEIVCVAADVDKLVGFCCGQIQVSMCNEYDYAVITECYISDDYRQQGIGKRLITAIEAEFINRDITLFQVATVNANTAALALCRSCGYKENSIMLEKRLA